MQQESSVLIEEEVGDLQPRQTKNSLVKCGEPNQRKSMLFRASSIDSFYVPVRLALLTAYCASTYEVQQHLVPYVQRCTST